MRINRRKKKKLKKLPIIIMIVIILIIVLVIYKIQEEKKYKEILKKETQTLEIIKKHYSEFVKTNKETSLYNDKGKIIGKINESIELVLEEQKIDKNTIYFKIKNLDNTYIKYDDIDILEDIQINDRYNNYIPFNQNIKTKNKTTFYDSQGNYQYTLEKSFDFIVIIKDENKYGIEFNNQLLYIHDEDVEYIYDNHNTDLLNSSGVAVLNYHFFYDETNQSDAASCQEMICHSKKQFQSHLDYFKENKIFTLTMNELEMYMDGKIQLPKSVLITIDDGGRVDVAVDMLKEYKMNATIFLITSWYDVKSYSKSEYIEFHSHSHNLHNGGKCLGGQGAEIKCLDREFLLKDLETSREALNGSTAFCYPFYEYNSYSTSIIKEAGFTMAFIGEVYTYYGYKLAEVGGNKFEIPRFVIVTSTTMSDIEAFFKEIR